MKNLKAIADIQSGKSSVANAAWWGFNAEDATETLQAAIDSGARRLIVPNMRADWIVISSKHGTGIRVSKVRDAGPGGSIEFDNCTVESTVGFGIKVQEKSAKGARFTFTNCSVINAASDRQFGGEWSPISLSLPQTNIVETMGGIDFIDCFVEDNQDRPAVEFTQPQSDFPLHDITGTVTVLNPHGVRAELGKQRETLPLIVKAYK